MYILMSIHIYVYTMHNLYNCVPIYIWTGRYIRLQNRRPLPPFSLLATAGLGFPELLLCPRESNLASTA